MTRKISEERQYRYVLAGKDKRGRTLYAAYFYGRFKGYYCRLAGGGLVKWMPCSEEWSIK